MVLGRSRRAFGCHPAIGVSSRRRARCAGQIRERWSFPQRAVRISATPLNYGLDETRDTDLGGLLRARGSEAAGGSAFARARGGSVANATT